MEDKKIVTIGEMAKSYEKPKTKNIAELDVVSTSFPIEEKTGTDQDNKPFTYNAIVIDSVEYRVPNPVLFDLKQILEKKPELKEFSVSSEGAGLKTRYTVIPL
jgi:hypothetical protein